MKLNLSTASAHLEPRAHELLNSIANVWPPAIRSKVRLFFSMMIHFAIEQINSEKLGTTDSANKKVSVECLFEYGVSYAQKAPGSLQIMGTIISLYGFVLFMCHR